MFVVYCLRTLKTGNLYTGLTNNIERRLIEHNQGRNRSTKAYIPYVLLFTEPFDTRIEARKREKYLKSGIGREYIKEKMAPWRN